MHSKLRSVAFRSELFQNSLQRRVSVGNQLAADARSASEDHVIMPSWLTKSALVIKKKNALCFSQSAFSNFALHVIKGLNCNQSYCKCYGPYMCSDSFISVHARSMAWRGIKTNYVSSKHAHKQLEQTSVIHRLATCFLLLHPQHDFLQTAVVLTHMDLQLLGLHPFHSVGDLVDTSIDFTSSKV